MDYRIRTVGACAAGAVVAMVAMLLWAEPATAAERRCDELGNSCVCSEPFNTPTYVKWGSSWYNPADSTIKECTAENGLGAGSAIARNSNDLRASNEPLILGALPSGHKVNDVLRGPEGHVGIWMLGHQMVENRFVKRMAVRWYRYYSPGFEFVADAACENTKVSEWVSHRLNHQGNGVQTYNFLDFKPNPVDCCFTQNDYPGSRAAWRGKWWRFETVFINREGPGYNAITYLKNVTDNASEVKVVDLTEIAKLGWTPAFTPPARVNHFWANQYRQNICRGFAAISHYLLAGWDTDEGQRIGAAFEIEGSGLAAPDGGVQGGDAAAGADGATRNTDAAAMDAARATRDAVAPDSASSDSAGGSTSMDAPNTSGPDDARGRDGAPIGAEPLAAGNNVKSRSSGCSVAVGGVRGSDASSLCALTLGLALLSMRVRGRRNGGV